MKNFILIQKLLLPAKATELKSAFIWTNRYRKYCRAKRDSIWNFCRPLILKKLIWLMAGRAGFHYILQARRALSRSVKKLHSSQAILPLTTEAGKNSSSHPRL